MFVIFTSCEEVVNVNLEESEPRLVIEASIIWFKGTGGSDQVIRVSTTSPFYQENINAVENAEVKVTSQEGAEYRFVHDENGLYKNGNFEPQLNMEYSLEVMYKEEIYTASEIFIPVTTIDYVEQDEAGGFSGEDLEIKAYYTDPADEENYYLFKFYDEKVSLEFYEDEFTNGNQIFGYFSTENIESGDLIRIEMEGISKSYYEFLFLLRSQIGTNEGGPFETMPATVRGNIINNTNPENYAFGYFRLSEADSTSFKVN